MAIRSFDLGGIRSLVHAQAEDLPNLVGISGPNGSGKSTLLETIRSNREGLLEPGSELLYVGPHRTWRSSQLSDVHVFGFPYGYEDILKQDSIPAFMYGPPNGLNFLGGLPRLASSADDSQALAKTAIVRLNNQHKDLIHREFQDQGGQIAAGSVADIMEPFRRLVTTLLPHLRLTHIDHTQNQNIRVLFERVDRGHGPSFDIDDLSSGEKAAIGLFLPFVEREAKRLMGAVPPHVDGIVPITMLLDEPEIHLHPLILLNVLEYMRSLASEGRAQFIFATQSPVLLDALDDDELFLLSPPDFVAENQLSRLSGSAERLEAARSLTGGTHLLTRGKPIVFIEGERERKATASDERLLKILAPVTSHWAIAPARGKNEVIAAASALRGASLHLPGMPVFGLVDSDTGVGGYPDYVIQWPVAMIENLLLDPEGIWALIAPYDGITGIASLTETAAAIEAVARARAEEEVRLRVRQRLPGSFIAPATADPLRIAQSLEDQYNSLREQVEAAVPADVVEEARQSVRDVLAQGLATERFSGKAVLRDLYKEHNLGKCFSWPTFLVETARAAAGRARLSRLAAPAIDLVRLYFPPDLVRVLEELPQSADRDDLRQQARAHREAWEAGRPLAQGREAFRQSLGRLARQQGEKGPHLFSLANAVGTP